MTAALRKWPRYKDPDEMCSYYRVIDDLEKVIAQLNIDGSEPLAQFLVYFACAEKLAASIDGLARSIVPAQVFRRGYRLDETLIVAGCLKVGFTVASADVDHLFGKSLPSAKRLRDQFMHRPGPSHLQQIRSESPTLIPTMKTFLKGIGPAKVYARLNYP